MATSVFARRVWWSLIFLLCLTVVLLAIYVGVFGEVAQNWLQVQTLPLRAVYRAHKGAVDLTAVVIGATVPAVTGGLAILKSFYYAEINLPRRLQELADEPREEHLHQRAEILSYVKAPFKTTDFLTPTILANPFSRLLKLFGWVSARTRARDFATAVDQFGEEIRTLNTRKEDIENRKITGHFLRAACFEAEALDDEKKSLDWKKHVDSALKEYKAILTLRPDELEALDGAARQCHRLGEEQSELDYLEAAVRFAEKKRQALAHARALRQSAAIIDRRSSPNEWNSARARLVTARRLVEHGAADGTPEASELAEILVLYGDVQTKREKFTASRKALNRAAKLFAKMDGDTRDAGNKRIKDARARLDEASGDKEARGG